MATKEVEHMLITRLEHYLKEGKSKLPLHKHIESLKNLYKGKVNSSSSSPNELLDLREKLYDLTNTMLECRSLSIRKTSLKLKEKYTPDGLLFIKRTRAELKDKFATESDEHPAAAGGGSVLHLLSRPNGVTAAAVPAAPTLPETATEISPYARETSRPAMGKVTLHGFDYNVKAVTAMLVNRKSIDQFKAIAITGKSGIGKTALAQLIFHNQELNVAPELKKDEAEKPIEEEKPKEEPKAEEKPKEKVKAEEKPKEKVKAEEKPKVEPKEEENPKEEEKPKEKFSPRIWVCTSMQGKANQETEIVSRILKSLGIEERIINHVNEKHSLKGLVYLLQLNLKGKIFLLVLDDVSSGGAAVTKWLTGLADLFVGGVESFGDKLSHGLPKGTGGTVIVTTRDDDLADKMVREDNVFKVLPLANQEDCLKIFRDEICRDGVERDIKKLREELLRNCAGVPLAAKLMGRILADELKLPMTRPDVARVQVSDELQVPMNRPDVTRAPVSDEIQVAA